jgi:hypothetical protein
LTVVEINEMTHDQLLDLISRRGRGRFDDPNATARAVREALRSSYPIEARMDEMVTLTLATCWDHMRFIERSIMSRVKGLIMFRAVKRSTSMSTNTTGIIDPSSP